MDASTLAVDCVGAGDATAAASFRPICGESAVSGMGLEATVESVRIGVGCAVAHSPSAGSDGAAAVELVELVANPNVNVPDLLLMVAS